MSFNGPYVRDPEPTPQAIRYWCSKHLGTIAYEAAKKLKEQGLIKRGKQVDLEYELRNFLEDYIKVHVCYLR